jgi:hypothetical protein
MADGRDHLVCMTMSLREPPVRPGILGDPIEVSVSCVVDRIRRDGPCTYCSNSGSNGTMRFSTFTASINGTPVADTAALMTTIRTMTEQVLAGRSVFCDSCSASFAGSISENLALPGCHIAVESVSPYVEVEA